jgi:integrase/recombinase XerD
MLEGVYSNAKALDRWRRSWLKDPIGAFLCDLERKGYKRSSLAGYANWALHLAEFAEQRGVHEIDRLPELIEQLMAGMNVRERGLKMRRALLHHFVRHLLPEITITASKAAPVSHGPVVLEYAAFLRNARGLCEMRIGRICKHCTSFLTFLSQEGLTGPHDLNPDVIRRFIIFEGGRCCRHTLRERCAMLRGFLSFLHRRGLTRLDWSTVVVSPRVYRDESCPRYLTRTEVEAVLAAIDRQSSQGKRDYAMFLLLTTYGLRGIEVRRLRLDEIDWRNEKFHIRKRKAGNNTTYPLAASVGEAILSYLKNGRPKSAHRQVFLSIRPPIYPLNATGTVTSLAQKYMRLAGVQVEMAGTHTFRYSCAQRLLEVGTPLKNIGDYLGHGHPDSTQHYMKIAVEQLREVANGGAEDLL